MRAPAYTAADYLAALQGLLPRGRVWPRDPDATQSKGLSGLAPIYERNNARANHLLDEALPSKSYELLPEWESTLGLPDPCAGPSPTVQGRRSQVVARFTNGGGQSKPYFINFAASLGYTITITQFTPAKAGMLRAGQPVCGPDWAHAWRVNAPVHTVHPFLAGSSAAGEPLSSSGNAVLECELQAIKPAHTTLFFQYS
jgi:uncharacterized protein YmfQ (DUF2313 family)